MDESSWPLASLRVFSHLPDPRQDHPKKLHSLEEILTITLLATLCDAQTWVEVELWGETHEEWLRTILPLPHGIPSHDTLGRVFALLDPDALRSAFLAWTGLLATHVRGVVALDGKTVRRSLKPDAKPIHLISAFAVANGLVLGQVNVSEKSNEITALPALIGMLNLKGCIATTDAMGCQVDVAGAIRERKGDYMLALKGNQGTLEKDTVRLFDWALNPKRPKDQSVEWVEYRSMEKDHGRFEKRWYVGLEVEGRFEGADRFPGAKSVWMVEAYREIKGKGTTERRYYLSSLPAQKAEEAVEAAGAIRGHWGIENSLHWVLDVVIREDENRTRTGNAAENLALIRKIVLNVLRTDKTKGSLKNKQKRASWDPRYLLHLLSQAP